MADYDWGSADAALKQKAGQWYDSGMLDDLKRNVSYGAGNAVDQNSVNDWVNRIGNKALLRGGNEANSTYQANGQGGTTTGPTGIVNGPQSTAQQWNGSGAAGASNDAALAMIKQMRDEAAASAAQNKQRGDALYQQLSDRAHQGLAIDRNDPVIRAQADAFNANQQRASRDYLSDLAEKSGPYANLRGEQRMQAEKTGQATGGFEAQLMGRELQSRRAEIQDALNGQAGLLSADQVHQLQRELGLMDNNIKQQQLGLSARGLDLQGQGQNNQNTQFYDTLGFNNATQSSYWDAVRRGLI